MDIEDAIQIGRENERAKLLLANHCLNADFDVPNVSWVGRQVNLPIGMATIRCKYAEFFGESQMDGIDLAVRFYERSCHGCPHQRPSGIVPTIASEAIARQKEREDEARRASQEMQGRRAEWELRQAARDRAMVGQAYPSRDLKDQIDLLDPDPTGEPAAEAAIVTAQRKVTEAARATPQLFTAPLVDTIVMLAEARDTTAHEVLLALATSGCFPRDRAAQISARTLTTFAMPEAGDIVAAYANELSPEEIAEACRGIIFLTAEPDHNFRPGCAKPGPLLAIAAVAWPIVRDTVVEMLREEDDECREVAAHAARHLLTEAIGRLDELGWPLIGAIRRRDRGYAGEPAPTGAVIRALSYAWPFDPTAVAAVVDVGADTLDEDSREQLVGIARSVLRRGEGRQDIQAALSAAVAFLIQRLDGAWGSGASTAASDDLTWIARDHPDLVAPHIGSLYNRLLDACQPMPSRSPLLHGPQSPLERLEQDNVSHSRRRLRRDIAEAIGRVARTGSQDALNRAFTLLRATTGDSKPEVATRAALVDVLARSVTTDNVASIIPRLYTALLANDHVVRAAAIELWTSCARVVNTLPGELEALLPALFDDSYKIVHGGVASALPKLNVSEKTRRGSIVQLIERAESYRDEGGRILRDVLSAMLWSADAFDDAARSSTAMYIIDASSALSPIDRERTLLESRLAGYRATPAWAAAALDVLSNRMRPRSSGDDDPLVAALLADPEGMAGRPLPVFEQIAFPNVPDAFARATEVVELLQAAGRWGDAATLANSMVERIEDTVEQAGLRMAVGAFAAVADAEAAAYEGVPPRPLALPENVGFQRTFWIHAAARHRARAAIAGVAADDPANAAEIVDDAARTMVADMGDDPPVAPYIRALQIAAGLLRFDAAVRSAEPESERFLSGSKRNAEALYRHARALRGEDDSIARFAARAVYVGHTDLDEVIRFAAMIPVSLPFMEKVDRSRLRMTRIDDDSSDVESRGMAPVVVCVPLLNGNPVVDTIVLRPDMTHDLTLELRMETWPEFADHVEIEFLSALPSDVIDVPKLHVGRAEGQADSYGLRFSANGHIRFRAARPVGSEPTDLPIHVRFVSNGGRAETAVVAGYERVRVIPYDPSQHPLTDLAQIDERLLLMYEELRGDNTLDDGDVKAFCRFFTACVNAARVLMFDKQFRAGTRVTEQQFHDVLEDLLRRDPSLGGRLSRRDALGGGFDDLRHDTIVAELKVVKREQKLLEGAARYVAQPTQYAVDAGSRLSIAIVLDHTPKDAPPRVLENDFRWELPEQHNDATVRYPSRVAVLTINTNWPVPSAWSGKPNRVK